MATSIFKFHILRKQNSLQSLWPHLPYNGGFSRRRFSQYSVLLLPHHLHFPSLSPPLLPSSPLHPPPLRPLLRRRFPPLFSPMSSLTGADNPTSSNKSVRVEIKGRVQGVFYRNWTIENAKELGLKGWVRNRRDGSVEALFSGTLEKVEEMEQRCRRGPPDAMVTGLQVFPCTDDPGTTFERKPTV
ncbi:hypothetical protein ACS0TY_015864 [Phlomoides rotata]